MKTNQQNLTAGILFHRNIRWIKVFFCSIYTTQYGIIYFHIHNMFRLNSHPQEYIITMSETIQIYFFIMLLKEHNQSCFKLVKKFLFKIFIMLCSILKLII